MRGVVIIEAVGLSIIMVAFEPVETVDHTHDVFHRCRIVEAACIVVFNTVVTSLIQTTYRIADGQDTLLRIDLVDVFDVFEAILNGMVNDDYIVLPFLEHSVDIAEFIGHLNSMFTQVAQMLYTDLGL